jgi:flagellar protein FlaI
MATGNSAMTLENGVEQLSLPVPGDFDKPEAYTFPHDEQAPDKSLVRPKDIEKAIPDEDKPHLDPTDMGYWLEEGFSLALIYRDRRSNEFRYYVVEPHISDDERTIVEYLNEKLIHDIEYDDIPLDSDNETIERIIQSHLNALLRRYKLIPRGVLKSPGKYYSENAAEDPESEKESLSALSRLAVNFLSRLVSVTPDSESETDDPESGLLGDYEQDEEELTDEKIKEAVKGVGQLTPRQVDKIMYELSKEYVDYKKITPLLHDVNVEDISVDGYNEPVWIYHSGYGDLKTNIYYGEEDLDNTVKYMAESDGRGISKRQPTVNVTLDDGSRAQLTLAHEVSEKGTNFTIRLYRDVPFTPIDLINWETYNIEQMAYLWLCVENDQKILFCGGTGAGKTTTLNACSLFIPKEKIVTIEDTPELTLPHENWVQSTTREHEMSGDAMNYEEFDLVEEAMRQRPSYILVGEVRNQKAANALMQTIETGHTSFSTFHADSVAGVINRFTNDPINVAAAQFSAIDLICLQEQLHIDGQRMRRAKSMTEIGDFEREEGTVEQDRLYEYNPAEEEFIRKGDSSLLAKIQYRNGWTPEETWDEFERRKTVLSYLIRKGIQDYGDVAAVIQGYMRDPEAIMALIAHERLEDHLEDLRNLDSLDLDINERAEEKLSRPVSEDMMAEAEEVLADNWDLVMETESYDIGDVFGIADQVRNYDTKYPFGEQIKEAQEAAAEEQQHYDDTRFGVKGDDTEEHFDAVRESSDDSPFGPEEAPHSEEVEDGSLDDLFDEDSTEPADETGIEAEADAEQTEDEDSAEEESPGLLTRLLPWRSAGSESDSDEQSTDEQSTEEEPDSTEEIEPEPEEDEESFDDLFDSETPSGQSEDRSEETEPEPTPRQDQGPDSGTQQPTEPTQTTQSSPAQSQSNQTSQESPVAEAESGSDPAASDENDFAFISDDETQTASADSGEAASDHVRDNESISVTNQSPTDESEPEPTTTDQSSSAEAEAPSSVDTHVEESVSGKEQPSHTESADTDAETTVEEEQSSTDASPTQESSDAKPDEVANPFADDEDTSAGSGTAFADEDETAATQEDPSEIDADAVESESHAHGDEDSETDTAEANTEAEEPVQDDDPYQPDITEEDIEQLKKQSESDSESQTETPEVEPEAQDDQPDSDPAREEKQTNSASSETDQHEDEMVGDTFVSADDPEDESKDTTDSQSTTTQTQEPGQETQKADAESPDQDADREDLVDAVDSAMDMLNEGTEETETEDSSAEEAGTQKTPDSEPTDTADSTETDDDDTESTEVDDEQIKGDPFQELSEIEDENSVSDSPFDKEESSAEAEDETATTPASNTGDSAQAEDTSVDRTEEQDEHTDDTAKESESGQQPSNQEESASQSPSEESQEQDDSSEAADSESDGQADERSREDKKNEQIQHKKREMLLNRSYYGETRDDVDIDPSGCLEILKDEEFDLYKQCQAPVDEDQNFCHHHPKERQPTVSAESDD